MSALIVAKFSHQFGAASAFDKLMSRGLPRRKGVVQCDESVGGSAASSSAPTTVVSRLSHRGEREGKHHHLREPASLPPAVEIGFAVLTVEIDDDAQIQEVTDILRGLHAVDVHVLADASLPEDEASLWPELGMGSQADVDRAIFASQQGKPRLH